MVDTKEVAPGRAQINPNGPNSKVQTRDPFNSCVHGIITGTLGKSNDAIQL